MAEPVIGPDGVVEPVPGCETCTRHGYAGCYVHGYWRPVGVKGDMTFEAQSPQWRSERLQERIIELLEDIRGGRELHDFRSHA